MGGPRLVRKRVPEQDYDNWVRQVVALRRAMDLLAARADVDKARVGFVGHDYGGMYGMMAAGVDNRARTYVYIAVAPSLNHWRSSPASRCRRRPTSARTPSWS